MPFFWNKKEEEKPEEAPPPIAYFDKLQEKFDRCVNFNSYTVEHIGIQHGVSEEGKFYLITFIPKVSKTKRKYKFTAKIQQNLVDATKSQTYRWAEKPAAKRKPIKRVTLDPIFNEESYHVICAKWLVDILFVQIFSMSTLDLMLPPRISFGIVKYPHILGEVRILVDNEEKDAQVVSYWLSAFETNETNPKSTSEKPKPKFAITSETLRIEIKNCAFFKTVKELQITGKTDIDLDWIFDFKGQSFTQNGNLGWVLSDEEIMILCEYYNEPTSPIQILKFEQGSEKTGQKMKAWFKEKWSEHYTGIDAYKRKLGDNIMFYFDMRNSFLKIGKCQINASVL